MEFTAIQDTTLVPYDGSFRVADTPTTPPEGAGDPKNFQRRRKALVKKLDVLQQKLYASNNHALLLVFQAMDGAGKDSTIRAVLRGVNPAGCSVHSFKQPSQEELEHDFFWRANSRLPERGRIGVWNRSPYEEVLVVRVHPEILETQKLPGQVITDDIWKQRFESIVANECHQRRNGIVVIKFWLNVSYEEQGRRFLGRIDNLEKNWKFSASDCKERGYWNDYMAAYEEALNATSRPHAPWYAIPADDKQYMRMKVAQIVVKTLESLDIGYPVVKESKRRKLLEIRSHIEAGLNDAAVAAC